MLTRSMQQSILRHYRTQLDAPLDKHHILTLAFTGKAAFGVEGSTIHSGVSLKVNQGFQFKPLSHAEWNTKHIEYQHLRVLIIDEISMVGVALFNFIDKRLQEIMQNSKPFGGLHVIVVGDLFQIPPHGDAWIFHNPSIGLEALAPNLWKNHFRMYELTTIMRQAGRDFAALLNRVREGKHTEADIEILKTRETWHIPNGVPHIYTTNTEVDRHNLRIFEANPNQPIVIKAHDAPAVYMSAQAWQSLKQRIPENHKMTLGFFTELRLKVGMRVEMVLNENTSDGLCNGADGILTEVTRGSEASDAPAWLWVKFEDSRVAKRLRIAMEPLYDRYGHDRAWTPIGAVTRSFSLAKNERAQVNRTQFPLAPCDARTVNRSQGMTMPQVCCDFRGRAGSGKHYVGLSRATSLEGLYLPVGGLCIEKLRTASAARMEMNFLRTHGRLPLCVVPLTTYAREGHFILACQNIRSWGAHRDNILATHDFMAADVLVCCETRGLPVDLPEKFVVPDRMCIRNDCNIAVEREVRARGLCTLVKHDPTNVINVSEDYAQLTYMEVNTPWDDRIAVIGLYRSPSSTVAAFVQQLQDLLTNANGKHIVVLGDFNIDPECVLLKSVFERIGARQVIPTPTRNAALLDHIWTTIPAYKCKAGTIPCFFSDHDSIYMCIRPPR